MRVAIRTAAAMLCFAANSLLCRAALRDHAIDPATFTAIRLAAGAVFLVVLVAARTESPRRVLREHGSAISAVALATYAIAFSLAYVRITAATGALLLFGTVQLTMMIGALLRGETLMLRQWMGWVVALGGMIVLTLPGLASPRLDGAAMMIVAGFSWGVYSLRGRAVSAPALETTSNFLRTIPAAVVLGALAFHGEIIAHVTPTGAMLAALSGALASGAGYAIWYGVVPALGSARAATVQLSVPVITALAAFGILGEAPHAAALLGGAIIIGGLALALA